MDLLPQSSSLYTSPDFSSLENENFKESIQVFIFSVLNIICALGISSIFLMSDCDCTDVEPSRLAMNRCYNHMLPFLSHISFVFALSEGLFKGLRCNIDDQLSGYGYFHRYGWFPSLYHNLPMWMYCGKLGEQLLRSHFPVLKVVTTVCF